MNISQNDLIKEFFINNPQRDIAHPEVVDWLVDEYKKRTGHIFRDPDRGIRKLHQAGFLQKIKKGTYRYDPEFIANKDLEDFSEEQKELIKKRDGYKCVICGASQNEGIELHVDHIKPKDKGGRATLENGQTLCATHNFRKKNLGQTETGKKMFIHLHALAKLSQDKKLEKFCYAILKTYEKHAINCHILWKK